jgi:hypothetical protein
MTFGVSAEGAATFLAGNLINIKPGFSINNGGLFKAIVKKNCPIAIIPVPFKENNNNSQFGINLKTTEDKFISVYPNPSSGQFTFEYILETEDEVSLTVFDKVGKKIGQLLNKTRQKSGTHQLTFDAAGLNDDMYIYLFESNHKKISGKLVKAK